MPHEREAAVAGRQERERGHQRRARADAIDQATCERAPDEPDSEQLGDHEARRPETDVAHVVQVDDQERDHDPVSERVGDAAGLEQPDGAGELRSQPLQVRGDGFQGRLRVSRESALA
jgi:hypothetical protein